MDDINNISCQCEWLEEEKCAEAFYQEQNGRRYCVLHYPNEAKREDFERALEARLDENNDKYLNFVGVWFPSLVSFLNHTFTTVADFSLARFSSDVEFNGTEFQEVHFAKAQFAHGANFEDTHFVESADFSGAHFGHGVSFACATFSRDATFVQANFAGYTDFAGVAFNGNASFMLARFENVADFSAARIPNSDDGSNCGKTYPIDMRRTRFKNAYFTGAIFTRCTFRYACFSETLAFSHVTVHEAIDFSITNFDEADFSNSHLSRTTFDGSFFLKIPKFNEAVFVDNTVFSTARLPGIDFSGAMFAGHGDFTLTRFESSLSKWEKERLEECHIQENAEEESKPVTICFDKVTFNEGLTFKGNDLYQDKALLTFDDAVFEKPERVRFVSVSMPPHSFMNVDPRKFHFIDARWGFIDKRTALREAQAALKKHGRLYSPPMLELVFRQLAVNAEENNRYGQAADLRYLAMEVARSMRWRKFDWLNLAWWYWLLSGYGEKVRRAFAVLILIWLMFAATYWKLSDETWWQPKQTGVVSSEERKASLVKAKPLTGFESLLYSASVMALQKPEPLPANKSAKLCVLAETVLGPLQAALLALAIRRKFMR
jgi:uncharacterized protein YjbI with pentapeptide repeats